MDCKDNIDSSTTSSSPSSPSSPQTLSSSKSEDGRVAVRLPDMDKRKSLEKDAKDLMTDSDLDQQQKQHSFLNSTSSSPCSFNHTHTTVTLPPPQQRQDVNKSIEPSFSRGPRARRGNQGIKAARQRFLLETSAKRRETRAAFRLHKVIKTGSQTSEMSSKSSPPLLNRSGASNSSSSISLTSHSSAQQKTAPQPVVRLPSQSSYAQNPTFLSTTTNGFCNQSSSNCRSNSASQNPLPPGPNGVSYPSPAITGRNHRVQNDWANGEYQFVTFQGLPDSITTRDLWTAFKREGYISHIRLHENAKGHRNGRASVKFRYAWNLVPVQAAVTSDEVQSTTSQGFLDAKTLHYTGCRRSICQGPSRDSSTIESSCQLEEHIPRDYGTLLVFNASTLTDIS